MPFATAENTIRSPPFQRQAHQSNVEKSERPVPTNDLATLSTKSNFLKLEEFAKDFSYLPSKLPRQVVLLNSTSIDIYNTDDFLVPVPRANRISHPDSSGRLHRKSAIRMNPGVSRFGSNFSCISISTKRNRSYAIRRCGEMERENVRHWNDSILRYSSSKQGYAPTMMSAEETNRQRKTTKRLASNGKF